MKLIDHDRKQIERVLAWLAGPTFSKPWQVLAYVPYLSGDTICLAATARREDDGRYYTIRVSSSHTVIGTEGRFGSQDEATTSLPGIAKEHGDYVFDLVSL